MVQFNFLNIEPNNLCSYDYLEFSTLKNSSIKVCGNDDRKRFLFPGNELFVRFHSDGSTTYEGFQIRYVFIRSNETHLINLMKTSVPCAYNEWKCKFLNTCIPKNWRCDNIRDCRDNSDETECFIYRSCHQSQLNCMNGACVPSELVCNGIKDCSDNSDEIFCNLNNSFDPFKTSKKNECSYQSVSPKQVDDSIDNSQIVGGSEAIPGSWPWMISLKYGPSHMCGGSLIAEDVVLTAAHCFIMDSNPDYYNVDLGRHFLYQGLVENIGVEKIIIHPSYEIQTQDFDLAIVKLKRNVKFTAFIQTVCIPSDQEPIAGKKCVILGWGSTQGTGGEGVLKQATVPIIERKTCNELYGKITNQMICAGYKNGGIDSCSGDSGGPLICKTGEKFKIYGVVSFGQGCALPNRPGVYTNVAKLVDWINEIMGRNLVPQTSTIATTNITTQSSIIQTQSTKRNTNKNNLSVDPITRITNNFDASESPKTINYKKTIEGKKFKTTTEYPNKSTSVISLKTTNKMDSSTTKPSSPKSNITSSFIKGLSSSSSRVKITEKFELKTKTIKQSSQSPDPLHISTISSSDPVKHSSLNMFQKTENFIGKNEMFYTTEIPTRTFYNYLSTRKFSKPKRVTDLPSAPTVKYTQTIEMRRTSDKITIKPTANPPLNNTSEAFRFFRLK